MMKKFRVWDTEENKYFEPIYEAHEGRLLDLSITLSGEVMRRTLEIPAEHESNFMGRYIVEQYIGIKDKNKVEMAEGDRVKVAIRNSDKIGRLWVATTPDELIGVVKYIDRQCQYVIEFDENKSGIISCDIGYHLEDFEIIGNIHTK